MSAFLRPFLQRWRLWALISSLLMLAIAHGFETIGGLAPCALCLRAREVYWVAAWVALAATGDPNNPKTPAWAPYDMTDRTTLVFGPTTAAVKDPRRYFREYWAARSAARSA